jgi:hypothetical protein
MDDGQRQSPSAITRRQGAISSASEQ